MTRTEILDRIRDVLLSANLVTVGYRPNERDHLQDELGMSNFAIICAFAEVAREFGLDNYDAVDDAARTAETIGDVVDLVAQYA